MPSPISSYYAATANPSASFAPLAGSARCDVCVVGGGITGLSAALHLAERGYAVTLLEAECIGWGASGRSGGQVIFGYAKDIGHVAKLVGRGDARRLWDMSLAAMDLTRALIAKHAIDCDWRSGQIHVAVKPRQCAELRAFQEEMARDYDYPLEYLERPALQRKLASPRYLAGLYDPRGGHLHPLNYTLGLARVAAAAGVTIHEGTRVTGYRAAGAGRPAVAVTAAGEVAARYLVFAGNAWLGRVVPALDRMIMPVGTYIVASAPLGAARAAALISDGAAVTDINFVLDYFRLSADTRLLFGGRVSYTTIPPPNLRASLRARMVRVFPQLADVPLDHAWGGLVDISLNRLPHLGRLAPEIYFAQGFSGHGMALTGLAGRLLAEAIAGTAERFDVFAHIPHRPFPGGPLLRVPALLLGTLYYRLRDWL
jgi:gamma-glutamylputrescine oxidase